MPPPPSSAPSATLLTTSMLTMRPAPCSSALLAAKRVPVMATVPPPSLLRPPPESAVLSVNEPPLTTTSPPEFECIPPPSPLSSRAVTLAAFFVKVELSTVTRPLPSLAKPPPLRPAFSLKETFWIVALLWFWFTTAPPQSSALFLENVVSRTSRLPLPVPTTAPPSPAALFSTKIEPRTERRPPLSALLYRAPPCVAAFSVNRLSEMVTWPEPLKIAPPLACARFLEKVVSSTTTVPAPSLEIPAPERPPPARLSEICEPVTVMAPAVSSSALFEIAPAPARFSSSPTSAAELLDTVLSVTVTTPPRLLLSALPPSTAKLSERVEFRMCTSPPTWLSIAPPVLPATLPVNVQLCTVTAAVLLLRIPPPYS